MVPKQTRATKCGKQGIFFFYRKLYCVGNHLGWQCDSQGGSRIARFRLVASAICKAAKFTQCSIEFVSHTVQSVIPAEAVYNRKT